MAADSPRTPLRTLQPHGDDDNLRRTPGGMSMDIVLTPALRPAPSKSVTASPMTPRDLNEKMTGAEARREEMLKLRKENIDEKLATVQTKKEELITEKTNKVREELENKLKSHEENRDAIIRKTKEDVQAYLAKVEQKVKEMEVTNEAEKITGKLRIDASNDRADENRSKQMEERIKQLQDHEDYVKSVIVNQEIKKKQYLSKLELSLDKATKRKEEHLSKVMESVKTEDVKIAEAKERREKEEKELQQKTLEAITIKITKVEENQATKEESMKMKIEEKNRKAELVKQNKLNLGPESA